MKTLFVGEGPHDIGNPGSDPFQPRPAQGVIPILARKVCPSISPESVSLAWKEIARFNPQGKKRGFESKVPAAVLVAGRFSCSGSVFVADRDGDPSRYDGLKAGVNRTKEIFPQHPIAFGLAVESIEAWTLGVPNKIAEGLGVDVLQVQAEYPRGVHVEEMSERSGKEEHRPKKLLEQITQLKHRSASTEFRQAVAERTEIAELEKACPKGFQPFAGQLRGAFV